MTSASLFELIRLPAAVVCGCVLVGASLAHADDAASHTIGKLKADRILILGNSITLHGVWKEGGWDNYCGMAASTPDHDYVHLLLAGLDKRSGGKLLYSPPDPAKSPSIEGANVVNIADILERQYATYTNERLKWQIAYKPDIVILQCGENTDRKTFNAEAFKKALQTLLDGLRRASNPYIFVTSQILGPGGQLDDIKREVCAEDPSHWIYVDLSEFAKDPANFARSEHFYTGVITGHPGDKGMSVIADALLKAIDAAAGAK